MQHSQTNLMKCPSNPQNFYSELCFHLYDRGEYATLSVGRAFLQWDMTRHTLNDARQYWVVFGIHSASVLYELIHCDTVRCVTVLVKRCYCPINKLENYNSSLCYDMLSIHDIAFNFEKNTNEFNLPCQKRIVHITGLWKIWPCHTSELC